MSYQDNYKKRVLKGTKSTKERLYKKNQMSVNKMFTKNPTSTMVPCSEFDKFPELNSMKELPIIVNDIKNNDKTSMDEKNIFVPYDAFIRVGSYLYWDDSWWLVVMKEHKAIQSHKKYIIKKCNQFMYYKNKDKVYSIPIIINNPNPYSIGLSDVEYINYPNSKRYIWYGANPITRNIEIGFRFMIKKKNLYRITHIDDFEYVENTASEGVIKTLAIATTEVKEDDFDNNVAWNREDKIEGNIKGEDYIYLGEKIEYESENDNSKWKLDSQYYDSAYLEGQDEQGYVYSNKCIVHAKKDIEYAGYNICLLLINIDTNETIDTKTIQIRGV